MKACAFFGHRDYNYEEYRAALKSSIVDLIENHAVTQFYSGGRGNFDEFASRVVYELKKAVSAYQEHPCAFVYSQRERRGRTA